MRPSQPPKTKTKQTKETSETMGTAAVKEREPIREPANASYDYSQLPEGFYQDVIEHGHPVRRAWHLQKFERVIECLPQRKNQAILDIGCFAGTFLGRLDGEWFSRQVGVDIVDKQ